LAADEADDRANLAVPGEDLIPGLDCGQAPNRNPTGGGGLDALFNFGFAGAARIAASASVSVAKAPSGPLQLYARQAVGGELDEAGSVVVPGQNPAWQVEKRAGVCVHYYSLCQTASGKMSRVSRPSNSLTRVLLETGFDRPVMRVAFAARMGGRSKWNVVV
jgi:hypothetical protein